MASIMISSFSIISVKDNGLLMPVLGSWVKNETGSVIMCIYIVVYINYLNTFINIYIYMDLTFT